MKFQKFLLILLTTFTYSNIAYSQKSCLEGTVVFSNQKFIDNFKNDYPKCSEIIGNVIIDETEGKSITNLDGLNAIVKINGYLMIGKNEHQGNDNLLSLKGLKNLKKIGASLEIYNNDKLENLDGLENLKKIEGNLIILDNDKLKNINGLKNISSISKFLLIKDNPKLKNIDGLRALKTIGEGVNLHKNITLENIEGFSNVEYIGNKIQIIENYKLKSLKGLDNINLYSLKKLQILGNSSLSNCNIIPICIYLDNPKNFATIFDNANGCKTRKDITNPE